jgi:transposase
MGVEPKTSRRELTPGQRGRIFGRWEAGDSIDQICSKFKRPRTTVTSIINRYKDQPEPNFENKPRTGAHPKLKSRAERALLRYATLYTRATLFALCTPSKSGQKIGRNLVRKTLKKYGKAKRKPRRKPYLRPENIIKRRVFCQEEKRLNRDYNKVC